MAAGVPPTHGSSANLRSAAGHCRCQESITRANTGKTGSYRNGRKLLFAPKIAPKMHFRSVILSILQMLCLSNARIYSVKCGAGEGT